MFAEPTATRANLPSRYAFSFVSAPDPKTPTASGPCRSFVVRIASATASSAASQPAGFNSRPHRTSGVVSRPGWRSSVVEVQPLMQSCPLLTGKCGSPCTAAGASAVPSPTSMPHWYAQYGQWVRTARASVGASGRLVTASTPPEGDEHGVAVHLDRVRLDRADARLVALAALGRE